LSKSRHRFGGLWPSINVAPRYLRKRGPNPALEPIDFEHHGIPIELLDPRTERNLMVVNVFTEGSLSGDHDEGLAG